MRNQADTLIYSTEKSLEDLGDKVDAGLKSEIESKTEELKKAMEGSEPEPIKTAMDALAKASHKIAEQLYAQKAQNAGPETGFSEEAPNNGGSSKSDDDVVDADYTEVK